MLPPGIGPITPYKRICGCAFILLAVVVAPGVHFALLLRYSPRVADASIWMLLGTYVGVIFVPRLRRVSDLTSYVALSLTAVLSALFMGFAPQIKQGIATGVGFYADPLPWSSVGVDPRALQSGAEYRDPIGEFLLRVPAQWKEQPGPVPGTVEFVLRQADGTTLAARLRPTCDFVDVPLAVAIADLLPSHPNLQRSCGNWRGMDACLLEDPPLATDAGTPLRWEWLARDSAHSLNIRLTFELFDHAQRAGALAIIHSVLPAKE